MGGLLVGLFVLFNVAYRLGAEGIKVRGVSTSFDRQYDHQLFKIDHRRAFLIHGESISVVKWLMGALGEHEEASASMSTPRLENARVYASPSSASRSALIITGIPSSTDVPDTWS